ncbi:MAG: DNA-directed RNA polymerase subunit alpha [Candidatus Firestonebacteria bacterium RIFOXYA2_FULL_40_8]|nr:MAG: DNA-directed RNA polymerase subunit alpha [Candidatus Firestonebacteria bacterium RIFOXYA2_FULL_40_8]
MKWKRMEMPKSLEVDSSTLTGVYGKFVAEPFERGYGQTVGTALRRVLLSSIQAAAVTSIKIENVLHEFGTIKGVLEDVTHIILNVKQIKINLHGNAPKKLTLNVEGAKTVTAGDITPDAEIEIVNPELVIATTTSASSKLVIEFVVDTGRGYVVSEDNKKEGTPIGVIPVDSIFTPVTRVNYTVENTRVGQQTDYEKLVLEIWTDGRIKPEEALSYAAKIMKDHLAVFIGNEDELVMEDESSVDKNNAQMEEMLKKSVDELELSVRSANCLKIAGIKSIDELVKKSENEMLKYRNFGKKSLKEISDILKSMGLAFNMDLDSPDIPEDCELPEDVTPIYVEKEKKPKKK